MLACVVVVALAGSCTQGETTEPGPSARTSPTGTRSSAGAASARAAAEPEPEPCTGSVEALDLVMKPAPSVPEALTTAIRDTAERAQQALAHVPLPGCDRRVTVVKILTGDGAANTTAQFQQVTDRRGRIEIWTGDWISLSTMGRTFVLVHEWWHQIQRLSAWCEPDAGCRSGDADDVPTWLLEGDANLQALRVADLLGLVDYDLYLRYHSGWSPRALAVLRDGSSPLELPPNETVRWYQMAQYAGHDLTAGKPLTFLRFWRLSGKTGDWRRAFEMAFGVDYDAYVAESFMGPDHLWA